MALPANQAIGRLWFSNSQKAERLLVAPVCGRDDPTGIIRATSAESRGGVGNEEEGTASQKNTAIP